jgi:hypothetical protein
MEMVEMVRQDIVAIWMEVAPTGETLEEFTARVNAEFDEADVIFVPSGLDIVPYPEECEEYSVTMSAAATTLEETDNAISASRTFIEWAKAIVDPLVEHHCHTDSSNIDFQTSTLRMNVDMLINPAITVLNEFLDVNDPANVDGLQDRLYFEQVLLPEIAAGVQSGAVVLPPLAEPTSFLPDFCMDRTAEDNFNQVA